MTTGMKFRSLFILWAVAVLVLGAAPPAWSFGFGLAPAADPTVRIELKGETRWTADQGGTIDLDAELRGIKDEAVTGDLRVVILAVNDRIDFDTILLTRRDLDAEAARQSQQKGFYGEVVALPARGRLARSYRIALPNEVKGKTLQVMVAYFVKRDNVPPEINREIYIVPAYTAEAKKEGRP